MINTAVIIANWNGKKHLKNCFDSLRAQSYKNFKTILVENGSEDGSEDFVREKYPEVEIVRLEENVGFATGYNIGIQKAFEDKNIEYIFVLNNDTKLHEKCVEELAMCAKKHPEAGSIQSKVLNFYDPRKIDCAGILFSIDGVAIDRGHGEKDGGQYDDEKEIFGANGTASLFSRMAIKKTQLKSGEYFDNDYFAYHEDIDIAWRLRLAGFKSYFCPKAVVHHIHSATAGRISGFKAYYLNRNRFFTLIKNYPFCRLLIVLFILTPARYIFLFFRVIMKKGRKGAEFSGQSKGAVAKEILRAWGSVISNFPSLVNKRRIAQKNKKVGCAETKRWFQEYKVKWLKTF